MVKEVRREDTVLTCKQDQRDKPCKITCPVTLSIGERSHRVDLQVDSGASCSVLSLDVARAMFKGCKCSAGRAHTFFRVPRRRKFGAGHAGCRGFGTTPGSRARSGRAQECGGAITGPWFGRRRTDPTISSDDGRRAEEKNTRPQRFQAP